MEEKFNLFKSQLKHTYTKKKEDFLDIALTTETAQNKNNPIGNLDFEIGSTDAYLDLPEATIIAKMKVTVAVNRNITLENNFFPAMFSQMVLRLNGNAFQTVDFRGVVDSIMKYITLLKDFAETEGCITSWFPDTHSGGVVNTLSLVAADNPTAAEMTAIINRLNKEKVNTGFQYRKK